MSGFGFAPKRAVHYFDTKEGTMHYLLFVALGSLLSAGAILRLMKGGHCQFKLNSISLFLIRFATYCVPVPQHSPYLNLNPENIHENKIYSDGHRLFAACRSRQRPGIQPP